MTIKITEIAMIVVMGVLLSACGSTSKIKPYEGEENKNLTIKTIADTGSFFGDTDPYIHVYRVHDTCKKTYIGTVDLGKEPVKVGIPIGQPTYLSLYITMKEGLGQRRRSVRKDTVVTAKPGYRYLANAVYDQGIYYFDVMEIKEGRSSGKVLPNKLLPPCN